MNFRFPLLGGLALLVSMAGAFAKSIPVASPPGSPEPTTTTNVQPSTPAPPQPNAKSAPGAASPNGSNGTTVNGNPVTKAPSPGAPTATNEPITPKPGESIFEKYIKDLSDTLKLSPDEQKEIQTFYLEDGPQLQEILNDTTLSPMQQAKQVSDLRDARDARIEALMAGTDRMREFYEVEARYRVALTEFAAQGGLLPALTPAPAKPGV